MTRNELYHHGILGMKWGVRRYQNPDGSLTEAGRKRYGNGTTTYGNVKVTKKDNGYQITDYERETYVDPQTLRVMSENADDMLVKDLAEFMGVKYQQAEEWLDNLSEPQIKEINNIVEDYMEMTLSTVLKSSLGKDVKTSNGKDVKASNGKDVKTSNSPKPKYTQEQAIEKAYNDLEKKYSNFNDLPLEKQDELFFDYVNESGLYEYI